MLNRLPRTISTRHLHTIVLMLIAGSLLSFAMGQQMAHGARTGTYAVGERISGWVRAAPSRPAVAHISARPGTTMAEVPPTTAQSRPAPTKHHDNDHGGDHQGGGDGGAGGTGGDGGGGG